MFSEKILLKSQYNENISNSLSYRTMPRFRWYGYKEGFSPSLVNDAIEQVGINTHEFVLDPFNGNGTVTLASTINNVKSIGLEVNPFSAFMSRVKLHNFNSKLFDKNIDAILAASLKQKKSSLLFFSTFSEFSGKSKWLFNSDVLNSFEGGWIQSNNLSVVQKELFQLALIGAALDNCNASKDGKCLKYKNNWQEKKFNAVSFNHSLEDRLCEIKDDLSNSFLSEISTVINCDSRYYLKDLFTEFKLCITSPPYLNSFDYTDIYRPELFLGKFINNNKELNEIRYRTIRSHVEIKLPKFSNVSFGSIYDSIQKEINNYDFFWDKQIPTMIQGYFEDMQKVLSLLKLKAKVGAQLWLVVANSVYAMTEIPVDLILAEIGTRVGWKLLRIEVLRNIQRRKTKHNGDIESIRESLIVFTNK